MFSSTSMPSGVSEPVQTLAIGADGTWVMPEAISIFAAEFARDGHDLLLETGVGVVRLADYFATQTPADLISHDGATLRGGSVARLAGPLFPAQYAQAGGPDLAEAIGQVETVSGGAFVQRTDGQVVELAVGVKVFQGDVVRTEAGGLLGLTFTDGTIFTLASGSRMVLDELIYDPQANDNSGVFDLVEGSFVFIAGQTAKTGGIEITTPAATMGIRGTTGKIDIQTVNGVSTVSVSLNPDPDGGLGAIELFDLAGNLITTITGTETRWIITPPFTNEPPIEVTRENADQNDDAILLSQALAAFQSAVARVQQGETFVELPEGEDDAQEDAPEQQGQPEEQGVAPEQVDPITPPPLDETGDGEGGDGESGNGNPELDGTDEPILEDDPGRTDDDDASLDVPVDPSGTDFADNGLGDSTGSSQTTEFTNFSVTSIEDTPVTGQIPVTAPSGETVPVSLSRGADNGLVVLAADGTFTYTPDADFEGTDTFEISGPDEDGVIQAAVVTVVVDPVNDAPVVSVIRQEASSVETGAGTAPGSGTIGGTLTFADVDQGANTGLWQLAVSPDNATAFGTASIDAETGNWTYDLDQQAADALTEGETFEEVFIATVTDEFGASDTTTLVITVEGTNDSPVIVAEQTQTQASFVTGPGNDTTPAPDPADNSVSGIIGYTDVDEGATSGTWSIAAGPDNDTALGSITIDEVTGRWTYVLADDAAGQLDDGEIVLEVYTATVTDVLGATATQDITITVTGTNEAPTIVFSIEDVTATVVEDGFGTADQTVNTAASFVSSRGRGGSGDEQTLERLFSNTDEGPDATGTLRFVDADGQPGSAAWSVEVEDASFGTMTIDAATGAWRYFLDQEAANSLRQGDEVVETFLATVTDAFGATASQVITITVQGSNDQAEVIANPAELEGAAAEDGVSVASGQLRFVDPDALPGETATWSVSPDADSRGVMEIDANTGEWTYTLDPGASQSLSAGEVAIETFTATVTDQLGATSDQTITIRLTGQNDAPALAAGEASVTKTEASVTLELSELGSDVDGADDGTTLTYAITTGPAEGLAEIDGTALIFSTNEDFDDLGAGETRSVTVDVSATDSSGVFVTTTLTFTVNGSDTGPMITSDAAAATGAVTEDVSTSVGGTLTYIDPDATTPTSGVWSVSPDANALGAISIDPVTGVWLFTSDDAAADGLNEGEVRDLFFDAVITDEDGQTAAQVIAVTVTGTNDAPTLVAGNVAVDATADTVVFDVSALGDDADAEDSAADLTYQITAPSEGTATLVGTQLTFTPGSDFDDLDAGETRVVVIDLTATDAQGASVTNTVSVSVTGSNTGPVITSEASAGLGTVVEAGAAVAGIDAVRGTLTYVDPDATTPTSGVWSVVADFDPVTSPLTGEFGSITINATTGAWAYTLSEAAADSLDAGDQVFDTFVATITDEGGLTDTQAIVITINGSNDAPTLTSLVRTIDKAEASLNLDLRAFVSDVDGDDGPDTLAYAIVTEPDFGTVVLEGAALTFFPNADFDDLGPGQSRDVTVEFSAVDGDGASVTSSLTVTVTGSNETPIITSSLADATGEVREAGVGVAVPPAGEPDATGQLSFTDDGTATWSVVPDSADTLGALFIDETSGQWRYVLDNDAADALEEGERVTETFTATVTDTFGATATETITINITGTNDAPVIDQATAVVTGAAAGVEPTTLMGQIDFADPDTVNVIANWSITPREGTVPTFGTITINADGEWRYVVDTDAVAGLADGEVRQEFYDATITDFFGAQDVITVQITIGGTNEGPVITSETGAARGALSEHGDAGSGPQTVSGQLTYDDPDETPTTLGQWSVAPIGTPTLGSVIIDADTGLWEYTLVDAASDALQEGEVVVEEFLATITDEGGLTATVALAITITGTNDSPVITTAPVTGTIIEQGDITPDPATSIGGTLVYTDVDEGALPQGVWSIAPQTSALGAITIGATSGVWEYTLDQAAADGLTADETRVEVFTATVTDAELGTDTQTITITVQGTNDAPTLAAATQNAVEDGPIVTVDLSTLGADVDAGEDGTTLNYSLAAPVAGVSIAGSILSFDPAGQFQSLAVGQTTDVTINVLAEDAQGATASNAVVVTVTGTNDAPTLNGGTLNATQNTALATLDLSTLGFDVDAGEDGSTLSYEIVSGARGVSLSGTDLNFTSDLIYPRLREGETSTADVIIRATDAGGAVSDNATVQLIVTGANDAPSVANSAVEVGEDDGTATVDLSTLANDIDDGQDGSTLSYALLTEVSGASISGTTLSYTPTPAQQSLAAGDTAEVVLTIVATDADGLQGSGQVTVTVTGANDDPTLINGALAATEDGGQVILDLAGLGDDIDSNADGSTLTYSIVGSVPGASIVGTELRYDPGLGFQSLGAGETTAIAVNIRAEDADGGFAQSQVDITITGVNDAPLLANGAGTVLEEGGPVFIDLAGLVTDADALQDGTNATYEIISGPAMGSATINGLGVDFDPNGAFDGLAADETADVTFTVRATDASGGLSNTATITVTVQGQSEAPVASDFTVTHDGNAGPLVIDWTGQVSDADGTFIGLASVGTAAAGTVSIDDRGTDSAADDLILYTPDALTDGSPDSFTYSVTDAEGNTDEATITVNVPANQAPLAFDTPGNPPAAAIEVQLAARVPGSSPDGLAGSYEFVRGFYTWEEARVDAIARGGFLATITSAEEQAFAAGLVQNAGGDIDAWLGGSDAGEEGTWRWVTGPEGAAEENSGQRFWQGNADGAPVNGAFENWFEGQPNAADAATQDYLALQRFEGGIWDDVLASDPRGYLLERNGVFFAGSLNDRVIENDGGDSVTFSAPTEVAGFSLSASGSYTFDPTDGTYASLAEGEQLDLVIDYVVTDRRGATDTAELTLTLIGDNDAPTVVDDTAQLSVALPGDAMPLATGSVATNDSDVDGDDALITYALSGSYDGLTLAADGTWTFDREDPAYAGLQDTETQFINAYYIATDAGGASSNGRLRLEITGANGAPVLGADAENITLAVEPGPPSAGLVQFADNGHYYRFVGLNSTFVQAQNDANLLGGHLATITSQAEQDFINGLTGAGVGWLGGSDAAEEGVWRWIDGPEQGQVFWRGAEDGAAENGSYENWDGPPLSTRAPQPNAGSEDTLHTFGDGTWNNLTATDSLNGYYLEYSGLPLIRGSVADNDSDPNGDTITYSVTSALAGATLDAAGNWTFDATDAAYTSLGAGATQTVTLNYVATDGNGGATNGSLSFNLTGVNNAPELVTTNVDFGSVAEGTGIQSFDLLTAASDPDIGDTLSFRNFTFAWSGDGPSPELAIIGGQILEIDTADFVSLETGQTATLDLKYDVSDGVIDVGRTATLNVTGVSEAINAADDDINPPSVNTTEDLDLTIAQSTLLGNDTGSGLQIVDVSQYSASGALVTIVGNSIGYSPASSTILNALADGEVVTDTFTYTIENGTGSLSDTATVSLRVSGLPPSADPGPTAGSDSRIGFEGADPLTYQVNPLVLLGTGVTYKFGFATPDGALPDFFDYDVSNSTLGINTALFTPANAGFYQLVLTGYEPDGENTSVNFDLALDGDGGMLWAVLEGGSTGLSTVLEFGADPDAVNFFGLDGIRNLRPGGFEDINAFDLENGLANDIALNIDDLLSLIDETAPADNNEVIEIFADSDDRIQLIPNASWDTTVSNGGQTVTLTSVDTFPNPFQGLGNFLTLEIEGTTFTG